jgi:hypothetical protein
MSKKDPKSAISQSTESRDKTTYDSFPQSIQTIIATLRIVVDQIDSDFKKARELILEIARQLDERKLCERNQISRTIKKILKDKIQEGKVTEKWIEECLAPEYKRKYTKSEPSSLSKQQHKQQIIEVSTEGKQVSPSEDVNQFQDHSLQNRIGNEAVNYNKPTANTESSIIGDSVSAQNQIGIDDSNKTQTIQTNQGKLDEPKSNIETSTIDNYSLSDNIEKITSDGSDKQVCSHQITREKYRVVRDAMDKSEGSILVKFDRLICLLIQPLFVKYLEQRNIFVVGKYRL